MWQTFRIGEEWREWKTRGLAAFGPTGAGKTRAVIASRLMDLYIYGDIDFTAINAVVLANQIQKVSCGGIEGIEAWKN